LSESDDDMIVIEVSGRPTPSCHVEVVSRTQFGLEVIVSLKLRYDGVEADVDKKHSGGNVSERMVTLSKPGVAN
jgi:hypothetical protein